MRKNLSLLICAVMIVSILIIPVNGEENVLWTDGTIVLTFDTDTATLTVGGQGKTDNYDQLEPTLDLNISPICGNEEIKHVIVEEGITYIGSCFFLDCINIETVKFPNTLNGIGDLAFEGCSKTTSVEFPEGIKKLGTIELGMTETHTNNLTEIKFYGNAPEIYGNSIFWDFQGIVYYPADNPTWTDDIMVEFNKAENCDITWIAWNAPKIIKAENKFTDIKSDVWYTPGIQYVYENGIMLGMGNDKFAPAGNVTREQVMQVLLTLEAPATGTCEDYIGFKDVKVNQWYSRAIAWAKAYKITSGVSENIFGLGQNVTREQLATFIKNYLVHTGSEVNVEGTLDAYEDADKVSDWAMDGMIFCVANGIIQGKSETTLDPRGYATRAELAQMLSQFLEAGFLYRVTFDDNGADSCSVGFKYIAPGTMFGNLAHAEKEGFTYGGWWYGDTKLENDTVLDISEHITVTVLWGDIRLNFHPNGGECDELSKAVNKGEAVGELPVPTRDGYTFEGWLYENGEESYIVTAESVIEDEGVYILTAQWTPVESAE